MYDSKKLSIEKGEYICQEHISTIGYYELEGSIARAILYFTKLQEEHDNDKKYDSYEIKCERDYDDERELQVWGTRKMTAEEIVEFDFKQEQQRQNQLEWKRRQFEELKKEFEGK